MTAIDRLLALVVSVTVTGCGGESSGDDPHGEPQPVATVGAIDVLDPFAPEPVTFEVGALYFAMHNRGPVADTVTAVSVDAATTSTLHRQVTEGGATRMEAVAMVELPPGSVTAFEPGGLHVMLEALRGEYRVGDTLHVAVTLRRSGEVAFVVPVIAYDAVADRVHH